MLFVILLNQENKSEPISIYKMVISLREDVRTLRLVSKLPDLRVAHAIIKKSESVLAQVSVRRLLRRLFPGGKIAYHAAVLTARRHGARPCIRDAKRLEGGRR